MSNAVKSAALLAICALLTFSASGGDADATFSLGIRIALKTVHHRLNDPSSMRIEEAFGNPNNGSVCFRYHAKNVPGSDISQSIAVNSNGRVLTNDYKGFAEVWDIWCPQSPRIDLTQRAADEYKKMLAATP